MKFGFVTCVQLGLSCMQEIYNGGGQLDLVITLHDKRSKSKSGRVYLDSFCKTNNITLVKIKHINDPETIAAIHQLDIDWLFIIGWSQIAGQTILDAPNRGCIGMHPTLLPQGRGRAAIPWAILKGLNETGVTMFKLDAGVDTGPILAQQIIALDKTKTTATTLYSSVVTAHRILISRLFSELEADTIVLQKQNESNATVWPGRKPEDGALNTEMHVDDVDRLVRAVTHPYPGAFLNFNQVHYRLWAGVPHLQNSAAKAPYVNDAGNLIISFADGCFEAIEWEQLPLK